MEDTTDSPFAVDPLQRGDFTVGLSQLDQSLSSYDSTVRGVYENLLAFPSAAFDVLVAFDLLLPLGPVFAGFSLESACCSEAPVVVVVLGGGVGVPCRSVVKALDKFGRPEVFEARIVLCMSSAAREFGSTLRIVPFAPASSSPTVAWRKSSINVHSVAVRSPAACFRPATWWTDCGAHDARFDS